MKKKSLIIWGLIALAAIGTTWALTFRHIDHENTRKAKPLEAQVLVDDTNLSGKTGTVPYAVAFKNLGESPAFVRFTYTDMWELEKDGKNYLLSPLSKGYPVATLNWSQEQRDLWKKGKDGWIYYRRVLEPGQSSASVLDNIVFPNYTGDLSDYGAADYNLQFTVEMVQASTSPSTLNSKALNTKVVQEIFGRQVEIRGEEVVWR